MFSKVVPLSSFTALAVVGAGSAANSNLSPAGLVRRTDLLAHCITASHVVNHPILIITSIPFESKIMRLARKSLAKILRLTLSHLYIAFNSPLVS
jgi:hypothetical protein